MQERDRLRKEAENLYAGGLELWGQMDAKPKAGGKKNPVMQVLQFLNPLAKRGDTGDTEFEETFSRILSGLGGPTKAGGAEAPGMTDAGIAAAMENPAAAGFAAGGAAPGELGAAIAPPGTPATPGGPVGGFSSAMQGEVGGMTAAPTAAVPGAIPGAVPGAVVPGAVPGAMAAPPPGEPPYVSPYFRDKEAERAAQRQQVSTILSQLRNSVQAKGYTTIAELQLDPQGMKVIQELQYLASDNDFKEFDELDEIYAAIGIQPARTPKNQFEDDFYRLARRSAGEGEPLSDREQQQFAEYQKLRRTGSDRVLSPNDQMFENAKLRNRDPETGVINMEKAFSEWTKLTAKSGTQGFQSKTGINPSTGRTEVMMVNNRTGDIEWPGIEVPSDFTFDKIMTRNAYGQGSYMDSGKIRFYYGRGDFSYEALQWFLQDMPPMALDPITDSPISNPEREKLERFIETLPDPSTIATIRQFVTGWNSDPANAAPERQISFEEARDKMRSLGLPIGGSAIAAWRDAREEGG
jgi:hypothetical protein